MTVKVLVTALGQQLIADTKQIENKESKELVGYWLSSPRVVGYSKDEEGQLSVNFNPYCLVSDEQAFSIRSEHIVAILEPRQDVMEAYNNLVTPVEEDGTDSVDTEAAADDADSVDGAAGDGATGAPEVTVLSGGKDEVEPAAVA